MSAGSGRARSPWRWRFRWDWSGCSRFPLALDGNDLQLQPVHGFRRARKAASEELTHNGFLLQHTGSIGKKIMDGEDAEVRMSLRLSGWVLRIDPRLGCDIS
jgi:hypothetical protein